MAGRSPLTKTQQRILLQKVKTLLTGRRNGKAKQEQAAYEKLEVYCGSHGVDVGTAIEQGIAYLKKHSIAASMNGLV
jgi:hypothetical protein